MSKILVIYQSKYGSTQQYAKWLAEALEADLFRRQDVPAQSLPSYHTIIYCGGLYAGGILGFSKVKKSFETLQDKKLIAVSVGASPPDSKTLDQIRSHNLSGGMLEKVHLFQLRGTLDFPRMGRIDRLMMTFLKKNIEKTPAESREPYAEALLDSYGKTTSFLDRTALAPIIACAQEPDA